MFKHTNNAHCEDVQLCEINMYLPLCRVLTFHDLDRIGYCNIAILAHTNIHRESKQLMYGSFT